MLSIYGDNLQIKVEQNLREYDVWSESLGNFGMSAMIGSTVGFFISAFSDFDHKYNLAALLAVGVGMATSSEIIPPFFEYLNNPKTVDFLSNFCLSDFVTISSAPLVPYLINEGLDYVLGYFSRKKDISV